MGTRRHALVIGVESYVDRPYDDTEFCHADAELIATTLRTDCDYDPSNVELIQAAPGDGLTPSEVIRRLRSIVAGAIDGDTVLFFFAGHGDAVGGNSYIVLPDTQRNQIATTGVDLADISNVLREQKLFCFRIFDCCHSGHDVRAPGRSGDREFLRGALRGSQPRGWATLAACAPEESSYPDTSLGHGVFTYHLAKAIRDTATGQDVLPEVIKVSTCDEVNKWARQRGKVQSPTMNASLSGNVALATRTAPPPGPKRGAGPEKARRSDLDIASRIAAVRAVPQLTDKHEDLAISRLGELRTSLVDACNEADWSGSSGVPSETFSADDLPAYLKSAVVPYIRSLRLRPQHKFTSTPIVQRNPFANIARSLAFTWDFFGESREAPVRRIEHDIDEGGFTPSCTLVEVREDTLDVKAVMVAYLLPLEFSFCAVLAAMLRERRDAQFKEVAMRSHIFKPSAQLPEAVQKEVDTMVEVAATRYRRQVERNLDALEREIVAAGLDPEDNPASS